MSDPSSQPTQPLTEEVSVRECSIEGCEKSHMARGWCQMHYIRWRKHGDPLTTLRPELVGGTTQDRFWAKVSEPDENGCRKWTGYRSPDGYGRFWFGGRVINAHQAAYEMAHGPVPEGMELDHVQARGCRSRACVDVAHLEPVTQLENNLRSSGFASANARKTHCIHGHEYTPENTRWQVRHTKSGDRPGRACRTCQRKRDADRKVAERLAPALGLDQDEEGQANG